MHRSRLAGVLNPEAEGEEEAAAAALLEAGATGVFRSTVAAVEWCVANAAADAAAAPPAPPTDPAALDLVRQPHGLTPRDVRPVRSVCSARLRGR